MSIINKIISRITRIIPDYIQYNRLLKETKQTQASKIPSKSLEINLEKPQLYHRYLYTLIKFFLISDYHVYFVITYRNFQLISEYSYLGLILSEKNIHFITKPTNQIALSLNDKNLSPNYFPACNQETSLLPIPMPQHPLMYDRKIWNETLQLNTKKKKSIFMIGNFDRAVYRPLNQKLFSAIDRISVLDYLQTEKLLYSLNSSQEFHSFLTSAEDSKCLIIQRDDFAIPMEKLRYSIAHFSFFLALPGVGMPHCHNLIEAMSTGAIPILHQDYANLMSPKLIHKKNALIYRNLTELKELIHSAYALSDQTIATMTQNIHSYYTTYLTPQAVVSFVDEHKDAKFALMAEHLSVDLFAKQKG